VAIKHAKTSGKADGPDATLVQPSDWNADHLGVDVHDYALERSNQRQWLNLGAGPTDLGGTIRAVCDLSKVTQVRCVLLVITAGVTGDSKLQYSTDNATWSDLTANLIDLSSTGPKASTWEDIPVGAKADLIVVRIVGVNGNTTEDPVVQCVGLQVR
jgi:hypothetical protein